MENYKIYIFTKWKQLFGASQGIYISRKTFSTLMPRGHSRFYVNSLTRSNPRQPPMNVYASLKMPFHWRICISQINVSPIYWICCLLSCISIKLLVPCGSPKYCRLRSKVCTPDEQEDLNADQIRRHEMQEIFSVKIFSLFSKIYLMSKRTLHCLHY